MQNILIPAVFLAALVGTDVNLYPIVNSVSYEGMRKAPAKEVMFALPAKSNLSPLVDSDVPVLVDFYADWCQPCNDMGVVLRKVANSTSVSRARIVKVNFDHRKDLVQQYGVETIPTLLVFKNGQVVTRATGVFSENQIRKFLQLNR